MVSKDISKHKMRYSEQEILEQLDLAFLGKPSEYFPVGTWNDIRYNFFLNLEHGSCETAGSKIHLYGDAMHWAVVFEKSGYHNRSFDAITELNYIGNCISYPVDRYPERNYITNSKIIQLISADEYQRVCNNKGSEIECFELISADADYVKVRSTQVNIEHNQAKYKAARIELRNYDNPNNLVDYSSLVRYLLATNPGLISATEDDIQEQLPRDLPKLLTLDSFHYESIYEEANPPSKQETYQLLATVLVTRNPKLWQPKAKPNNDWRNWESGNL